MTAAAGGPAGEARGIGSRLRRDLGTLESYATLLGILIGAGIFRVTTDAWNLTGPSVILGYLVLAPVVLATSVPYAVFLSTPLGREPGGEYTHISQTFGGLRIAFVVAWMKAISYMGAMAFLANAFADYVIPLSRGFFGPEDRLLLSLGSLVFFYGVHVSGVRWFGRLQVLMCTLLGLSILVLVVPGLFAIQVENYRPFFTHGPSGFAACLPPLFFAFAGFESLAQTAGEVKDSTARLPRVFLKGIAGTTLIFGLMALVTFGVLPGSSLATSTAPMAEVSAAYLPSLGSWFVTLGAVMALTTSLNASMLVPSRLGIIIARDGLAPPWLGSIHPRTGTPVPGLTLTLLGTAGLLASGQMSLALNVAVFALVVLYFLHGLAFLLLPRRNPALFRSATARIPYPLQVAAALISLAAMGGLIAVQVVQDAGTLRTMSFAERIRNHSLTSLELTLAWGGLGFLLYTYGRWKSGKNP